jgi:glycosyltransferase involved in cell wall biosynthesis
MIDGHAGDTPLVSIILPVHNGESYIGDTLESALLQTYRNIELIVVDDGSRDGTKAVVDAHASRDPRVRVIHQANRGVAEARNRAIAAARGEFIAPLDADDLWDPAKIERQVGRMVEAGDTTGLVYCWWVWVDAHGALLDRSPRWRFEGEAADVLLQVNYTGNASVPLYRRQILEQIGGYDPTFRGRGAEGCEDLDVALKVAERSRVAVVPSPLVAYRRHRAGMSARTDRMWRSYLLVMEGVRHRRPSLRATVIRQSRDQFALYLAGVSFWSGAYRTAIGWAARALRSRLWVQILPSVASLFMKMLMGQKRDGSRIISPGVTFSGWEMPAPLIPYDRIYERRLSTIGGE